MSDDKKSEGDLMSPTYSRATLVVAAALFISFCLLLFFLPQIMLAIGGNKSYIAGAVIGAVLILPFVGLWLRGRSRNRD